MVIKVCISNMMAAFGTYCKKLQEKKCQAIQVTKWGRPAFAVMLWEEYERIINEQKRT